MPSKRERSASTRNIFRDVASDLQKQIADCSIELGRYLPTERDLQLQYNVSRSTIRRALSRLIDDGWAHNVPNKGVIAGSGLRPLKSNRIAIIDQDNFVTRVLFTRMQDRLRTLGYELEQFVGVEQMPMEQEMLRALDQDFAGIILWPYQGFPNQEIIRRVCQSMPVVVLDHRLRDSNHDLVTFDHFENGRRATRHLIEMGCQRVAITGMMDMLDTTHQIFCGYMAAQFDAGLKPQARDYAFIHTSGMEEADPIPLRTRLTAEDRPDGLLVLTDDFLAVTIETALRVGLRVPQDIKVMSIGDDVDVTVESCGTSAVARDWDDMMNRAVELIVERIEDPMRSPRIQIANSSMVIRGLCGAPQEKWNAGLHEPTSFNGKLPFPRKQYSYRNHWSVDVADRTHSGGITT